MKQISRDKIMQNIKKEYAEAKDWCRQDFGRCYQIMIDTEDGDIWLDVFVSENNWKIYKSQTIQNLHAEYGNEKGYVDDAIRILTKAGWTIID